LYVYKVFTINKQLSALLYIKNRTSLNGKKKLISLRSQKEHPAALVFYRSRQTGFPILPYGMVEGFKEIFVRLFVQIKARSNEDYLIQRPFNR